MPAGPGDMLPVVYDITEAEQDELRLLSEAVAGWRGRYPDVVVQPKLVRDRPARALVERSRYASLLVVGARGRGDLTGLVLGSVSRALLHHGDCPVVVVRNRLGDDG